MKEEWTEGQMVRRREARIDRRTEEWKDRQKDRP